MKKGAEGPRISIRAEGAGGFLKTFKHLVVWQKAYQMCLDIY